MKNLASILCLSVSLAAVAGAQEPLNQNIPDSPQRTITVGKGRDGFFIKDNKVFMVRAGVTTLVEREMLFPNGIRVLPNATVTLRDGRETTLLPRQWLTFEGSIDEIPVVEQVPQRPVAVRETVVRESASTESGVSSRDGITVSGADVFITRNGSTEKITSDMKLSNGVIVHPDGTVLLASGKKITLRSEQVLDFRGVVHEAPVRPNPAAGVDPAANSSR